MVSKKNNVIRYILLFCIFNIIFYFLIININVDFYSKNNVIIIGILLVLMAVFCIFKYIRSIKAIINYFLLFFLSFGVQIFFSLINISDMNINQKKLLFLKNVVKNKSTFIFICIMILVILLIYSKTDDQKNYKELYLFPERENDTEKLKKLIDLGSKSILIDDKWGNGKTFFIRRFIQKFSYDFEFIYIKAPYFNDKIEFRKKILDEISFVLKKNNILNTNFITLTKYFGIEWKGIHIKEVEKNYDEIIKGVNKDIDKIGRKIVLIIDDLDRIDSQGHIIEALNFIGEINLELENNFCLITLASQKKLNEVLGISIFDCFEENYLEKYFSNVFQLSKVKYRTLVEYFSMEYNLEDKKIKILKQIEKDFLESSYISNLLNHRNKNTVEKWNELRYKEFNDRATFRNIEKLVQIIKNIEFEIEYEEKYLEPYIILKFIQILNPVYWEKIEKLENFNYIEFDNKINSIEDINTVLFNQEIIFRFISKENENIFANLKNYDLGGFCDKISIYDRNRIKILNGLHDELSINHYIDVARIFKFSEEEKLKIFENILSNNKISQLSFLELMIKFNISFYIKYDTFENFKKDIQIEREIKNEDDFRLGIYGEDVFYPIYDFCRLNLFYFIKDDTDYKKIVSDLLGYGEENFETKRESFLKIYLCNLINKNKMKELKNLLDYLLSFYEEFLERTKEEKENNEDFKNRVRGILNYISENMSIFNLDFLFSESSLNYNLSASKRKKIILDILRNEYNEKNVYYKEICNMLENTTNKDDYVN